MASQTQTPSLYERVTSVAGQVFDQWSTDNAPRLAASLAYYTILAAAPLLVISVVVADKFFGDKAVQGQLAWEIHTLVGGQAADTIQDLLRNAHEPTTGLIATILSIVSLAVGASSVVVELQSSLNLIWNVPDPSTARTWIQGAVAIVKQRFFSVLIVIGAGCLLLISLLLSVFLATVGQFFQWLLPTSGWILHLISFAVTFVIVALLFAAIYKVLPDVHLRWSDVITGASVTALLFTIGKQLVAIYLGHVGLASVYGAAWSLLLLLVWIYYSAQLFFLGAEFTKVYARTYGSHRGTTLVRPIPAGHSSQNRTTESRNKP